MSQYFLAFDVESGGLNPKKADLLTAFFAILDEDFKILEELPMQLKPEDGVPVVESGAMAVNGIDLEKHLSDPNTVTYSEGSKRLEALIRKYLKKRGKYSNIIAFGYNVMFDIKWVNHYLIDEDTWNALVHYKAYDVMQDVDVLKRHGWLPPTCGNLGSMVEYFGLPVGEKHVARDDIVMTINVFRKVKEFMDNKKNNGSSQDLISLLEAE